MYNPAAEIEACQTDVLLHVKTKLCTYALLTGTPHDSYSPLPCIYYIYDYMQHIHMSCLCSCVL